jgi:ribosomal protein L24
MTDMALEFKGNVSTTLTGSKIKKSEVKKDESTFRAYVLVEYPIRAANVALMDQIKKNEQMYTRYRSAQSFEELQKEVDKYEDFKKQKKDSQ